MLMYQLLESQEWVISEHCPQLIETLPELTHDERNVEDIAKSEGDDCAEAARYGLKSRPGARRPPLETRLVERLQEIDKRAEERGTTMSATVRAIYAQQFENEERRKDRPLLLRRFWRRR